ncbi:hypothetical protein [Synechococcus sp. RS9916]|uniref:hypothetical protein n=1 Tax=Synechococcus sp. RS9916 TaxID=221359 RepID=UPI0002E1088F|nr:hypothetical protein [Synechococcus sp. RS9916]
MAATAIAQAAKAMAKGQREAMASENHKGDDDVNPGLDSGIVSTGNGDVPVLSAPEIHGSGLVLIVISSWSS